MNFIIFIFSLFLTQPKPTDQYGKVIKITDGDTFTLLLENKTTLKIRMNGIDAPEKKQEDYRTSKQFLSNLIFRKRVKIIGSTTDKYKRTLADVYINADWINLKMVAEGFAWHYKKYSTNNELSIAESNARKNKNGIWKNPNAIAPWEFRKLQKKI
jgi:micrococcal nuclease